MIKRLLILITLSFFLAACVTTPPAPPPLDGTDQSLAEGAYSVSRSLVSLAAAAQASHPCPPLAPPPSPETYGMAGLTSVDWSGPIEPLVRELAKVANYHLRILGTPPAIPVIVTVYEKNTMLADILRNVGYQAGRRAAVVVFPESRVIELRYAKN